jgi:hypothetical protein
MSEERRKKKGKMKEIIEKKERVLDGGKGKELNKKGKKKKKSK